MINIALLNMSRVRKADEIAHLASVLDLQIRRDFAPAWGKYATCIYAPPGMTLSDTTWRVQLLDEPHGAQDAGAYGYHVRQGKDYIPQGKVFTTMCERFHESWTAVASHEVLEMLGDPQVNIEIRRMLTNGTIELWPQELCDATQEQAYSIDGLQVSNFVLPEYFIDGSDGPYDFLHKLKAPFSISDGGYSSVTRITKDGKVHTYNDSGVHYPAWRKEERPGSRRDSRYGGALR